MLLITLAVAAGLLNTVSAHVRLGTVIPGFGRIQNKGEVDNRGPVNGQNAPYAQEFCKGWQRGEGKDRAKRLRVGRNEFDLETNMAAHNGGSMQVSLSFDEGRTFKVIKSWIGNYPRNRGGNEIDFNQRYDFNIPADARSGYCIFSWSWTNEVGNREFYHDCAPIIIEGGGTSVLADYPDIFVAQAKGMTQCEVDHGVSVEYPNPGRDVVRGEGRRVGPPKGPCGPVASQQPPSTTDTAAPPKPEDDDDDDNNNNTGGGGNTYRVVSGDTCNKIANQFSTNFGDMRRKNPRINADCTNLEPGQELTMRRRSRIMIFE